MKNQMLKSKTGCLAASVAEAMADSSDRSERAGEFTLLNTLSEVDNALYISVYQ